VLTCKVPVNILFANTKEVEGQAVGQMVVELPGEEEDAEKIVHYLKDNGIKFEEVN
jgi:D-methionine transport system ATP-binding protein